MTEVEVHVATQFWFVLLLMMAGLSNLVRTVVDWVASDRAMHKQHS